ncbi:hypothetical protein [Bacillus sp. ISL-55]|uniref:hypothetical protein n=1 Tax=Bacillus sp. ISL-55 TaxID=2819134 RepID=UPI00257035C9|nr:hypothetical protein [Bacillus sp. ISL-55]
MEFLVWFIISFAIVRTFAFTNDQTISSPSSNLVGVGHFGFTMLMTIVSPTDFIIIAFALDGLS